MSAKETSFTSLIEVPVHYDRDPPAYGYGSKGKPYTFHCQHKLKNTLEKCLSELMDLWGRDKPTIILSAGTIGDGAKAHGQGLAFDLDGFYWGSDKFMMAEYKSARPFYNGINAHLFLYFSQVLSFHYPKHHDHFHVDFNFSYRFRTASNAQTFFLQSCLVYNYGKDIGTAGTEDDGVDGVYGHDTKAASDEVLKEIGLWGQGGLTSSSVWIEFLKITRQRAFT